MKSFILLKLLAPILEDSSTKKTMSDLLLPHPGKIQTNIACIGIHHLVNKIREQYVKKKHPKKGLYKLPGLGGAVVSALKVVNLGEVTPASLAPVTLGRPGGFLVFVDLLGGIAVGCCVVLVTA